MINLGKYNRLHVRRLVDFGAYLTDGSDSEILLPARYMPENLATDNEIDVFVYRDNEERLIATTDKPFACVGEFAFLEVRQVNKFGAFLDWGLMKELLVPFSEQKVRMREGGVYLVYVYVDNTTQRIVASAKIEKFTGNILPRYNHGDRASALVVEHIEGLGYRCIVDNLHWGMIYENELSVPLKLRQTAEVFVRHVREDGKIDLTPVGNSRSRELDIADRIMDMLNMDPARTIPYSDHSAPETIRDVFGCSKKDFKRAIGHLYSKRKIILSDKCIRRSGR